MDLKAAFDTVNKEKLWIIMEWLGISKYLIGRIKEMYKETKIKVRLGAQYSEQL